MECKGLERMARQKPVKVVWQDERNKSRFTSFDMIPQGLKKAKALRADGFRVAVYVQGELFEPDENGGAKAYDPRYEIPY